MPDQPNFLTCPAAPELEPPEGDKALPPPNGRRIPWKSVIALVLVLLLAAIAPLAYGLGKAGAAAALLRTQLKEAVVKAQARDFAGASTSLDGTDELLDQIATGLRATGYWRGMPYIGRQITALEDVGQAGAAAVEGARALLQVAAALEDALVQLGVAAPALETGVPASRSFHDLTVEEKRMLLARFNDRLPDLRVAREKIDIASDAWARVPQAELFAPLRDALAPIAAQLPAFRNRLDHAVSLIEVLVPLAGYPTPKRYLVLLQNADELRPTGGFIGTVGVLNVDAADLGHLEFKDVYAYDNPATGKLTDAPPSIMKRELGITIWYLRDSNWSPDFPQSSERIMDVFNRELTLAGAPTARLDGVIALEPEFFRRLLRMTGPITVDGKTFSADNFFDELEYDVEMLFHQQGIPTAQRKEIVAKVGDLLLQKLMGLPAARWPELLDAVTESFSEKDIQIYDRDPSLLALLDRRQWSGRVLGSSQDYLMVVDANLAAYKTDGVMHKEIHYAVDTTPADGPRATVTLIYTNNAPGFTWRYTRYRDYVRIYVPEGSQLISSEGAMLTDKNKAGGRVIPGTVDTFHELGKQVFGAFWSMEPHETRTLRFTYRLPASAVAGLADGTYQLLVQRQAGANTTLTLDHAFGKNVTSATPSEDPKEFGDARYRASFDLIQDRNIEVKLAP